MSRLPKLINEAQGQAAKGHCSGFVQPADSARNISTVAGRWLGQVKTPVVIPGRRTHRHATMHQSVFMVRHARTDFAGNGKGQVGFLRTIQARLSQLLRNGRTDRPNGRIIQQPGIDAQPAGLARVAIDHKAAAQVPRDPRKRCKSGQDSARRAALGKDNLQVSLLQYGSQSPRGFDWLSIEHRRSRLSAKHRLAPSC